MPGLNEAVLQKLEKVCDSIIANEQLLSDLDRRIGDGDHGANMKRGCLAIKHSIADLQGPTLSQVANKCAMILLSTVGGASGPLLASGLMRLAKDLTVNEADLTTDYRRSFLSSVQSFMVGIKERGKAEVGDKTFVDYLQPFCDAYGQKIASAPKTSLKELVSHSVSAGQKGLEHTVQIAAKKGRASYLGDRSIGTADPGATTMSIVFKTIEQSL